MILLSLSLNAQVTKVYGYLQGIQGGAMQDRNNKQSKAETARYFLFAAILKKRTVYFQQVWIKGNLYSFKPDTIKKIPFILESSNGGEMVNRDTLVKSSTQQIIQLKDLVKKDNAIIPSKIKKLIAANDVVIVFKYRDKTSTITLRKLTSITPLFTQ